MVLPVRVKTPIPILISAVSGVRSGHVLTGMPGPLVIDGVAIALGDRILASNLLGAANTADAGVYTCTRLGTNTVPYQLTRAIDFCNETTAGTVNGVIYSVHDQAVINGMDIFVREGVVAGGNTYMLENFNGNLDTGVQSVFNFRKIHSNQNRADSVRVLISKPIYSYTGGSVGTPYYTFTGARETATITFTASPPTTASGPLTVDGLVLSAGDRMLVTGMPNAANNGVYIVADNTKSGWTLMRAPDQDGSIANPIQYDTVTMIREGAAAGQHYTVVGSNTNGAGVNPALSATNGPVFGQYHIDVDGATPLNFVRIDSNTPDPNLMRLYKQSQFVLNTKSTISLHEETIASRPVIDGAYIYSSYSQIPPRGYIHNQGGTARITSVLPGLNGFTISVSSAQAASAQDIIPVAGSIVYVSGKGSYTVSSFSNTTLLITTTTPASGPNQVVPGDVISLRGYTPPRRLHLSALTTPVLADNDIVVANPDRIQARINMKLVSVPGSARYQNGILKEISFRPDPATVNGGVLAMTDIMPVQADPTPIGFSPHGYRYYLELMPGAATPIGFGTELEITKIHADMDAFSGVLVLHDLDLIPYTIVETSVLRINFYRYIGTKGVVDKSYVDSVAGGTKYLENVRTMTTDHLPDCDYYNGPADDGTGATLTATSSAWLNGATVNGIGGVTTLVVGDRILVTTKGTAPYPVTNPTPPPATIPHSPVTVGGAQALFAAGQTEDVFNGIYIVTDLGTDPDPFSAPPYLGTPWTLTRSNDGGAGSLFNGSTVLVGKESTSGNQLFAIGYQAQYAHVAFPIGTTLNPTGTGAGLGANITWVNISSSGALVGPATDATFGELMNGTVMNTTNISAIDKVADAFDKVVFGLDRLSIKAFGTLPTFPDYFDGNKTYHSDSLVIDPTTITNPSTGTSVTNLSQVTDPSTIVRIKTGLAYPEMFPPGEYYLDSGCQRVILNSAGVVSGTLATAIGFDPVTAFTGGKLAPYFGRARLNTSSVQNGTTPFSFGTGIYSQYSAAFVGDANPGTALSPGTPDTHPSLGPFFKYQNPNDSWLLNLQYHIGTTNTTVNTSINTSTNPITTSTSAPNGSYLPMDRISRFSTDGTLIGDNSGPGTIRIEEKSYVDLDDVIAMNGLTQQYSGSSTRAISIDINSKSSLVELAAGNQTYIDFPEPAANVYSSNSNENRIEIVSYIAPTGLPDPPPYPGNTPITIIPRMVFHTALKRTGTFTVPFINSGGVLQLTTLGTGASNGVRLVSGVPVIGPGTVMKAEVTLKNVMDRFLVPGPLSGSFGLTGNIFKSVFSVNGVVNGTSAASTWFGFRTVTAGAVLPLPTATGQYPVSSLVINSDQIVTASNRVGANNPILPLSIPTSAPGSTTVINNTDLTSLHMKMNTLPMYVGPNPEPAVGSFSSDTITYDATALRWDGITQTVPGIIFNTGNIIDTRSSQSSTGLIITGSAPGPITYTNTNITEKLYTTNNWFRVQSQSGVVSYNINLGFSTPYSPLISYDSTQDLSVLGASQYQYELQKLGGVYAFPRINFTTKTPAGPDYSTIPGTNKRWATFVLGPGMNISNGVKSVTIEIINSYADTGLTTNNNGIVNNADFEMFIGFFSGDGITACQVLQVDPLTNTATITNNPNMWWDCNRPYQGKPSTYPAQPVPPFGCVDMSATNTATKKRLTFGGDEFYGDIVVRIGMSINTHAMFSGLAVTI